MKEVLIKKFNSIAEAELAKNLLNANRIISMVQKRGARFPGDMGDSFGADLFVSEKNLAQAREILDLAKDAER